MYFAENPLKKTFSSFFFLPIFIQGAVGTITETITSASTGEVIPYAGVTMTTAGGSSISTSANSSGVYLLGNLDPDSYTFAAGDPSGSTEYQIFQTNVTISSGATTTQEIRASFGQSLIDIGGFRTGGGLGFLF